MSLKRGLQSALVELDGCPRRCQTDQSSIATHVRGRTEGRRSGREYNARYLGLLAHYGLEPAVIGVGEPHENGDVESAHGHLRTSIDQAFLTGSRQFASVAQYEAFLFELLRKRNATRGERFEQERSTLRALPPTRWPEYDEEVVPVSREALCRVGKQAYSVPARYAGERLRVRIWETELEFFWNGEVVERTERREEFPVDYPSFFRRHRVPLARWDGERLSSHLRR